MRKFFLLLLFSFTLPLFAQQECLEPLFLDVVDADRYNRKKEGGYVFIDSAGYKIMQVYEEGRLKLLKMGNEHTNIEYRIEFSNRGALKSEGYQTIGPPFTSIGVWKFYDENGKEPVRVDMDAVRKISF